ncbi:hypothetical protein HS088_TW04G00044 [Tripterygium wilfordii]|uniref:ubiquitinyl hydrolase 1 n=1 Tax=Tripterygium wilfordii TaxID=458696 RepID=A0A7J7DP26_TRIWF|nr:ubiquitin carboxyl-terminal hydrolase 18-like isoform X2 [Tripterygium wilfordii]KAF5748095.1 hypothetical protein HS088_TW04G00044 [Tripterygium wilfordii]
MHVNGVSLDLNWFLQLIFTVFIISFGLLHLVKNTASKYFEVDANFEGGEKGSDRGGNTMPGIPMKEDLPSCAVCGSPGSKKCSRCKSVRYCSSKCQTADWNSGHNKKCKDYGKENSTQIVTSYAGVKSFGLGKRTFSGIALVPNSGSSSHVKKPRKVLFPYEEFVKLFNWEKPGFPPCGLLNCGNSCFANVVLQCLTYTRPLIAYLLENGHKRECRRNDWCFLCDFQDHVERTSQSQLPFSPMNILSRLPNIGGNLGYGRQEDAHEFMRFAIDAMQSVCLDEFGGEKAVHPSSQETTLIQHIFGGHLQSQVICTNCNKISNQYENMMDLTVEIHGDASSLEECLDQFTVKEWLHGENMYRCDGCNDYVKAWKRLTIRHAPNILTIALKRFQSGRFGKLNKRVTFPETLDLSPYMSDETYGTDVYKLYAVVVHVDMLNASFFGHYICYTKDFCGRWHRIDDCKVTTVDLDEVLSQGAYMLLYNRVQPRASCLRFVESSTKGDQQMVNGEAEFCRKEDIKCFSMANAVIPLNGSGCLPCENGLHVEPPTGGVSSGIVSSDLKDIVDADLESGASTGESMSSIDISFESARKHAEDVDMDCSESSPSILKEANGYEKDIPIVCSSENVRGELVDTSVMDSDTSEITPVKIQDLTCGSTSRDSDDRERNGHIKEEMACSFSP